MPTILDPTHPAFHLSSSQIRSYLRWSERMAWALAILIPLTGLLAGTQKGLAISLAMAAILGFLARELGRGQSEAAIGLFIFALTRVLVGQLGLIPVPMLFALVELVVFAQGARAAMALKRESLQTPAGDAIPSAAASPPPLPPERGWTKRVWFDLTVGVVLVVISVTTFILIFADLPSDAWGGVGLLLIPILQLAVILVGFALIVAALGGTAGRLWVPKLRWITYLVLLGGLAMFGGLFTAPFS